MLWKRTRQHLDRMIIPWPVVAICVAVALFPFFVLAQADTTIPGSVSIPTTGSEWVGLLLKTIVLPVVVLAGKLLWGWIGQRKSNDAIGRVLAALDVIGQPIWDKHVAELGLAMADGRITPEERQALIDSIEAELPNLMSRDTLNIAIKALGLPSLAGLSSWILSKLLARWKGAHDPSDPSVPNSVQAVYPVSSPIALDQEPLPASP